MSEQAPEKLPKDIAAQKGMVNVQIDGTWYEFPRGMSVIEACRQTGVIVPHFCYHPKLSVRGSCRMCLVEQGMPPRLAPGQAPTYDEQGYQPIQWMPRAIIACANTIGENMAIRTKGTLVEKVRRGVMEFLLINHPLDCPICDKAGECLLQENAYDYGQGESRFVEDKVKKPKHLPVGPRITLDTERCIMCGRCIRFMREVAKDPVLTFTERGTHTTVSVYPGRELDHPYSMNVTDICPVGALTTNDFRHKMRVWFLKETPTLDVHDGTGINITVGSREEKIYRIKPRRNDAVNSDWMPDAYRLDYAVYMPKNRFTRPFALSPHGAQEATTWESALKVAAEGLGRFTPEQIAIIASARSTNEELFITRKLAATLKTTQIAYVPRTGEGDDMLISSDKNPNSTGANLILGINNAAETLANVKRLIQEGSIRAVVVVGEDLTQEAGFSIEDVKKLDYLVMTAVTPNETTKCADIVLPTVNSFEKYGTMINVTGRLQRLNQVLKAPETVKQDWKILWDLVQALGCCGCGKCREPQSSMDILTKMSMVIPSFKDVTWMGIGDSGMSLLNTGITIPLIEREKSQKR